MKRRFYIVPADLALYGTIASGRLMDSGRIVDSGGEPQMVDIASLFLRVERVRLTGNDRDGFILMIVIGFMSAEGQKIFHAHPDVAILPDHETETAKTFGEHLASSESKFTQEHLDALAALGIEAKRNIGDLWGTLCGREARFMQSARDPLHFMYGSDVPEGVTW